MRTPYINGIPINRCVRCGWKNEKYEKEGYYATLPN